MRRSRKMERYLRNGAARGGQTRLEWKQVFDLPRCAAITVAQHLFMRRSDPSSKEGNWNPPQLR
jgi:hypothetical protein